jgi:Glycosyl transferase family 2
MPFRVLFLCLSRDCADTIPQFFAYLNRLEASGFRCTAIIGENGSSDGTRAQIERAVGPAIALLDTSSMASAGSRLTRMAIGRQALLEAARARGVEEEYICIADLDNVINVPPEPAALQAAIERLQSDESLFAIGATSSPVYYDLLSLRAEGYEFLSTLNREIAEAKKKPLSYFQFHRDRIYRNQRRMTTRSPVLCESSFNGFCVYRAEDYVLGSYRAEDEADVCEHVSHNLSIGRITGKKMLIMPELRIQTPADHGPVGFFRFWLSRASERLPKFGR